MAAMVVGKQRSTIGQGAVGREKIDICARGPTVEKYEARWCGIEWSCDAHLYRSETVELHRLQWRQSGWFDRVDRVEGVSVVGVGGAQGDRLACQRSSIAMISTRNTQLGPSYSNGPIPALARACPRGELGPTMVTSLGRSAASSWLPTM